MALQSGAPLPLYDPHQGFTLEELEEYLMSGYVSGPLLLATDSGEDPPLGYFTCTATVVGRDHEGVRLRLTRHLVHPNVSQKDLSDPDPLRVVAGSAAGRVEDVREALEALEDSDLETITNLCFVPFVVDFA